MTYSVSPNCGASESAKQLVQVFLLSTVSMIHLEQHRRSQV
jgi:hypothetical protein